MNARQHALAILSLTMLLGIQCGCSPEEAVSDVPMSPTEYFDEIQSDTETPHGRVVPGSAREADDGRIQYDTPEGTFETTAHPNGQGYRFSDVEQVESR